MYTLVKSNNVEIEQEIGVLSHQFPLLGIDILPYRFVSPFDKRPDQVDIAIFGMGHGNDAR